MHHPPATTTAAATPARTVLRRAAFLDRDGVINLDKAYVHRWEDFAFVPGAIEAMRQLKAAGHVLVVVTNQSGLARGLYTPDQYDALTARMCEELARFDAAPDAVYHCPHHPQGTVAAFTTECRCRKPEPGMLLQAATELGLSLPDSIMVGDKPSDIQAARAAGVGRAYQVSSDNASAADKAQGADGHFADLLDCVRGVLGR